MQRTSAVAMRGVAGALWGRTGREGRGLVEGPYKGAPVRFFSRGEPREGSLAGAALPPGPTPRAMAYRKTRAAASGLGAEAVLLLSPELSGLGR